MPHLVEHDGGALPGDAVLPVVVGGVHRGAAEHAGDGAGGIGAVIGDATPGGRGANVTGVVVSQEGLDAHELRTEFKQLPVSTRLQTHHRRVHSLQAAPPLARCMETIPGPNVRAGRAAQEPWPSLCAGLATQPDKNCPVAVQA